MKRGVEVNRDVFYIAGFDPRSPKYYYSIFKNNINKTSRIEQDKLNLSKLKNEDVPKFKIDYKGAQINYNFLAWNDIVAQHFCKKFFDVFGALFLFFIGYTISGVTYMVAKYSRTQLIAGYYPTIFMFLSYCIIGLICYAIGYFIEFGWLWIVICLGIILLGTRVIFYIGQKAGIFWLLSIYRFCYKYAKGEIDKIDERNESFANTIIQSVKDGKADEIMVVAHSVGTILAISTMAKVIKKCKAQGLSTANLKLVLIGGCVPLTSFQKCGNKFKKELEIVANSDITWLDLSSKIDGACFFMLDYVKRSGVQVKRSPKLISVRFFKIYDKKTYKNIRYKWYQVHFLYLRATQISGGYDYFYMVADPLNLENKTF